MSEIWIVSKRELDFRDKRQTSKGREKKADFTIYSRNSLKFSFSFLRIDQAFVKTRCDGNDNLLFKLDILEQQ